MSVHAATATPPPATPDEPKVCPRAEPARVKLPHPEPSWRGKCPGVIDLRAFA